jgi:hypothetical protein
LSVSSEDRRETRRFPFKAPHLLYETLARAVRRPSVAFQRASAAPRNLPSMHLRLSGLGDAFWAQAVMAKIVLTGAGGLRHNGCSRHAAPI